MSFERIGPYDLSRSDLIAATIIIPFVTASRRVRVVTGIYLLLPIIFAIIGIAIGSLFLIGLAVWLALWIFVLAPALRSRKRSRDIYIEYSVDGIIGETPQARTIYKWASIGTVKKVGSRLFIMISDGVALVIPDRSTTPENIQRVAIAASNEGLATKF